MTPLSWSYVNDKMIAEFAPLANGDVSSVLWFTHPLEPSLGGPLDLAMHNAALSLGDTDVFTAAAVAPVSELLLLGDYNNSGVVDAADYTLWQDNLGLDSLVLGGNGSGAATVVLADYETWKTHFGETIASGSEADPVPEPTTLLLALLALASVPHAKRRS